HARVRDDRLRHAPAELPDGAPDPGPRPGRAFGQEPLARPVADRRRPQPLLHPADQRGPRAADAVRGAVVDPGPAAADRRRLPTRAAERPGRVMLRPIPEPP